MKTCSSLLRFLHSLIERVITSGALRLYYLPSPPLSLYTCEKKVIVLSCRLMRSDEAILIIQKRSNMLPFLTL